MWRGAESCALRLQRHFGPHVLCSVVPADGDPARLRCEEREVIASAVPARRREFAAGRACARALLSRLGFDEAPLLPSADRSPRWPVGAIGSIAHDGRFCAVAVARATRFAALGVDVEKDEPLEEDLSPVIATPRELESLSLLPLALRGRALRLLFSAKECVYKCIYPLTRTELGFHDVEIELVPGSERFAARLRPASSLPGISLAGFQVACAGSILTGMSLAASCRLELAS